MLTVCQHMPELQEFRLLYSKKDKMMFCLVSTLSWCMPVIGSMAGKHQHSSSHFESQLLSCLVEIILSHMAACDLQMPVLFPLFLLLMGDLVFSSQLWNQFISPFLCPLSLQLKPRCSSLPSLLSSHRLSNF